MNKRTDHKFKLIGFSIFALLLSLLISCGPQSREEPNLATTISEEEEEEEEGKLTEHTPSPGPTVYKDEAETESDLEPSPTSPLAEVPTEELGEITLKDSAVLILNDVSQSVPDSCSNSYEAQYYLPSFLISFLSQYHGKDMDEVIQTLQIGYGVFPNGDENQDYDFTFHYPAWLINEQGWIHDNVDASLQIEKTNKLEFMDAFIAGIDSLSQTEAESKQLIVITDGLVSMSTSDSDNDDKSEEATGEWDRIKPDEGDLALGGLQALLHEENIRMHLVLLDCENNDSDREEWEKLDSIRLISIEDRSTPDVIFELMNGDLDENGLSSLLPSSQWGWTGTITNTSSSFSLLGDIKDVQVSAIAIGFKNSRDINSNLILERREPGQSTRNWRFENNGIWHHLAEERESIPTGCNSPTFEVTNQPSADSFVGIYWWQADRPNFEQKIRLYENYFHENNLASITDQNVVTVTNTTSFRVMTQFINSIPAFFECYEVQFELRPSSSESYVEFDQNHPNPYIYQNITTADPEADWMFEYDPKRYSLEPLDLSVQLVQKKEVFESPKVVLEESIEIVQNFEPKFELDENTGFGFDCLSDDYIEESDEESDEENDCEIGF